MRRRLPGLLPLALAVTACNAAPSVPPPADPAAAEPSAASVCEAAATPTPDIGLRATVVQQAQISSDPELRQVVAGVPDDEDGTATAVVPTDEGAPPVARRYDAVFGWCQNQR